MDDQIPIRPRRINAEPLLFLYSLSLGLYITVYQAFITFKICISTVKNSPIIPLTENVHEFCMDLVGSAKGSQNDTYEQLRDEIEAKSTQFMIYYQIIGNIPAILIAFMVGAWSDAFGRKPPIIIALAGSTISGLITLVAAASDSAPLYLVLIATFVSGATGQVLVIYSGAFAMISDAVPDPVQLTVRIGLAGGILSAGMFLASILSGVVLSQWDNYSYIFAAGTVILSLAFFYTVFIAEETLQLVKPIGLVEETDGNEVGVAIQRQDADFLDDRSNSDENAVTVRKTKPRCGSFRALFNFGRVRESYHTLVRQRAGRRRLFLLVSLIGFIVVFSSDVGMPGILNLYVKRPPISLTDSQYSYLMAAGTGAMAVGMVFLPWLAKRVLHTRDTFLIVIGLMLAVIKMLGIAFSTRPWMIFVASSIGGMSSVYFAGYRAYMSKLVERDETGRLFSAVTSSEHIGPLVSAVVFNNIFAATLHWFAGFVYIIAAVTIAAVLVVMSWVHFASGSNPQDDVDQNEVMPADDDRGQLIE